MTLSADLPFPAIGELQVEVAVVSFQSHPPEIAVYDIDFVFPVVNCLVALLAQLWTKDQPAAAN